MTSSFWNDKALATPRGRRCLIGWLGLALAFTLKTGITQAASDVPRGVFSLGRSGEPANPRVLADSAVDGISVRTRWCDLESSRGVYYWGFLDSEIARAERAGKKVLVRILSEGQSTPRWVLNEGVQSFQYGSQPFNPRGGGSFVIPWDPKYLAEKKAMIEAAGAHLAGQAGVQIVAAICASERSGDWAVPHTSVDIEHWHALGYTSEKLIGACQQIIDVTMGSFPKQSVMLAVGRNGKLDPDPDYVPRAAIEYAHTHYPGRLVVQKDSLSAVSPLPGQGDFFQILWDNRPNIAGQMLWFSYGDRTCRNNGGQAPCDPEATLRRAIDIGLAYGMKYIEIYQRDVVNLPQVIRYAHNSMAK
jgi:hypothetical protein